MAHFFSADSTVHSSIALFKSCLFIRNLCRTVFKFNFFIHIQMGVYLSDYLLVYTERKQKNGILLFAKEIYHEYLRREKKKDDPSSFPRSSIFEWRPVFRGRLASTFGANFDHIKTAWRNRVATKIFMTSLLGTASPFEVMKLAIFFLSLNVKLA